MTPQSFVSDLAAFRFKNAFNPYAERCAVYDADDAPCLRSAMLTATLVAAARAELDSIWVGRDLGYRGGRRTGLPFTDDVHLGHHRARWGVDVTRPTKGEPVAERAATVVWKLLDTIPEAIFLWNVFPLHPHEEGRPFTNRLHTAEEARTGLEILRQLIGLIQPKRILAIGNDAEKAVRKLGTTAPVVRVRHPSFGGQTEFVRTTQEIYGASSGTLL